MGPRLFRVEEPIASVDRRIVRRLLRAYRYSIDQSPPQPGTMWEGIFAKYQREAHDVFCSGDIEASQRILSRPAENKILYGFDALFDGFVQQLQVEENAGAIYTETIRQRLVSLAEALGVIRTQNPAGPKPIDTSLHLICGGIERCLGFPISAPMIYAGEVGIEIPGGFLPDRAVQALYQVSRLRRFASAGGKVVEIGGGLGRTAAYATRVGLSDYTIVDIPFTMISQGYWLMNVLGPENVSLPGEPAKSCRLMTPAEFLATGERFDVALNVDSLTELSKSTAEQYVQKIASCARVFISINHECNEFRVSDLLEDRVDRFPCWIRRGYVEEIVRFKQKQRGLWRLFGRYSRHRPASSSVRISRMP